MKKLLCVLPLLAVLVGCSDIPREAFFNRGSPESLLDVSSEIVTVAITSDRSVEEVVDWIDRDQPTRAELMCYEGDMYCSAVEEVLSLYGLEYEFVPSTESAVHLIYERIIARDCEHRYIDNHINPYNMNHPAFGCSIASNMVQQVSDKRQFVSPALLDYYDAEKGVKVYNDVYLNPPVETDNSDDFEVDNISSD